MVRLWVLLPTALRFRTRYLYVLQYCARLRTHIYASQYTRILKETFSIPSTFHELLSIIDGIVYTYDLY